MWLLFCPIHPSTKKQLYEIESQRSMVCVAVFELRALGRSSQYKLSADFAVLPLCSRNDARALHTQLFGPRTRREPALYDQESLGGPPSTR
jgi:hypothetical protein